MTDHKTASTKATASLVQMVALGRTYQAAVIRGGDQGELGAIRGRAHDMLDLYLDQTGEAGVMALKLLEDHPDSAALAQAGARTLTD